MRIEFQLTLTDWLEWKRASLSQQRLAFLLLAEGSLIPLIVVFGLTIVLAWLRYIPGWVPIVILSLIALGQIYLAGLSRFRVHHLKEEWLREIGEQTITVETNQDGFDYFSNEFSHQPVWNEVASVYQSKRLLMFYNSNTSDGYVLLIPKHAFASKQQLDEFLDLAYQETVANRHAAPDAASEPDVRS